MNGTFDISFNFVLLLALLFITVVVMIIVNSVVNLNKKNSFKAKLYDKEMESQERERVIAGLDKDLRRSKKQLDISIINNSKLKQFVEALQIKLSRLRSKYAKIEQRYTLLDHSYKNLTRHKRSLETELANVNERYRQSQSALQHYRGKVRPEVVA